MPRALCAHLQHQQQHLQHQQQGSPTGGSGGTSSSSSEDEEGKLAMAGALAWREVNK